jgi:hypothetical protein
MEKVGRKEKKKKTKDSKKSLLTKNLFRPRLELGPLARGWVD